MDPAGKGVALQQMYCNRFAPDERRRTEVWKVLTQNFFQQWIRSTDSVLDVAAGYCDFINNIKAQRKLALDLNPATSSRADSNVQVLIGDVTSRWSIPSSSIDVVFTSNFFEHLLTKEQLAHCLREAHRVLVQHGLLIAMGPNIRFCSNTYWDFWDHHLPLSDRSLVEGLELCGFRSEKVIDHFLPYTLRSRYPAWPFALRLYLRFPALWNIFGKQFVVVARKA